MDNLFNSLGQSPMQSSPFGNIQNLLSQYRKFRQTFSGDPNKIINEKLKSGEITQAQLQQAQTAAANIMKMLNMK